MKKLLILSCICLIYNVCIAQKIAKKYTLFHPVPREKMREMSTDRPDITESANTVDAGHFQIETDMFKHTSNKNSAGITSVENNINLANLKLGITHNLDLQLVVGTFVNSFEKSIAQLTTQQTNSFGDLTLRAKYNFWGNDEGKTAFAVMPYLNLPTSKNNNNLEGGIIFPFSVALVNNFSLGTQLQVDWLKLDSGYGGNILQSVVIGKAISKHFEAFAESYYTYNLSEKVRQFSINGGIGYLVNENLKFDAGFNLGITKNTDKVYFIGFSFRY